MKKKKKLSFENDMIRRRKLQAFQGGLIHPILGYLHTPVAKSSKMITEFSAHDNSSDGYKFSHV